jgi:ComF family protein
MEIPTILKDGFSSFKEALFDLFFPPICPFCDSPDVDTGNGLCSACVESIEMIEEPFCAQCGLPLPKNHLGASLTCGQCLVSPPAYHRARFAVSYKGVLRVGLQRFKYGGALYARSVLTEILVDSFRKHYSHEEFDLILPIPVHTRKLRERGFNQAILLAEDLSARTLIPLKRTCLIKSVNTPPQAGLHRQERLKNLRGSFRVARPGAIKNKRVLLVDDVSTTGSTIGETARILNKAGAVRVDALVLALTSPKGSIQHSEMALQEKIDRP